MPIYGGKLMPKKKRASLPVPKFKVGDKVRVKHGIRDADYPAPFPAERSR